MTTEETVIAVIKDHMGADSVTLETKLREDLDMNSSDIVELVMDLEDEFDAYLGDADGGYAEKTKFQTVGDVVDAVVARLAKENP